MTGAIISPYAEQDDAEAVAGPQRHENGGHPQDSQDQDQDQGTQGQSSRFQFVGDTKAPQQLSLLQQTTKRRNREHRSRIASVEERMSTCMSQLVRETSHCESQESQYREEGMVRPMERLLDHVVDEVLEGGMAQPLNARLLDLEANVSLLTQQMVHVETTKMVQWKRQLLDPHQSAVEQLRVSVQLEAHKSSKREEALRHRLDTALASNTSVLFADSHASVAALLQRLEESTIRVEHSVTATDEERLQHLLNKARKVNTALKEERSTRQRRDEEVLEEILATQKMLETFVLESVSHNNEYEA
jgi:hypothetical protein